MKKNYFNSVGFLSQKATTQALGFFNSIQKVAIIFLMFLLTFTSNQVNAQITYTLGNGTFSESTAGVTPFSTDYKNSRTQYLYYGVELLTQGAINGNIIQIAINISELALPTGLYPQNVNIKMMLTSETVLGTTLIEGLPVYYSASSETITNTGWHTFTLNTPFEWDGSSNILVEICRSNTNAGTAYGVLTETYNSGDFRTVGLYSSESSPTGCNLTGAADMADSERQTRPNAQFTMTLPCTGTPAAGVTTVSAGPYCNGEPFLLQIANGDLASGLLYQWESSPNQNGPFNDIEGATSATYQTTQAIATYYRRHTICSLTNLTTNSLEVLVDSEGCYCAAEVLAENAIGITNVAMNTIDNFSPSTPSYSNFTAIQTEVNRNSAYTLSAKVNTVGGTNYTKAWIDWNQNGTYDANEGYDLGTATGTDVNSGLSPSITIPATAALGATNMRIRTSQSEANEYPAACGPVANGEGEDYTLVILESLSVNQFNNSANTVWVYQQQGSTIVQMEKETIAAIKIYDLSGRLLWNKNNINASKVSIDNLKVNRQVLLFQITTQNGAIIYKKVIN